MLIVITVSVRLMVVNVAVRGVGGAIGIRVLIIVVVGPLVLLPGIRGVMRIGGRGGTTATAIS